MDGVRIVDNITERLKTLSPERRKLLEKYLKKSNIEGVEEGFVPISTAEKKEYYPLSPAQKRMYILRQLEGSSTSYNTPGALIIEGPLNRERIEGAFRSLIQRHEAFRTSFELVDDTPMQKIHGEVEFGITFMEAEEDQLQEILKGFIRPFDLSKAPLLRAGLVKVSEEKHILFFDMHHIISDGVSSSILIREFNTLYSGGSLPALTIQYKDFSEWQNQMLRSDSMKAQKDYWLGVFSGEIPVLGMPTDYPRPSIQSFEGNAISFEMDGDGVKGLNHIAAKRGATLYMVLLAAYNILLSKYSGQEDIVIGSPIAGRRHADLEGVIGMFVSTLAMRNYPESFKTFGQFLNEVKENSLKAYANQDFQFEELIESLNLNRDLSRNPLFTAMFVLQNVEASELAIENLNFKPYEFDIKISKFDLTLEAVQVNEKLVFTFEYCTKLFKKETIERLADHYRNILECVIQNEEVMISGIDMMSEKEKKQVLFDFNATQADYPKDKTLHELFEEQVKKAPGAIAAVYEDKAFTYGGLNARANQLGRVLREKGVQADSIVAIMAERSLEMITGILGILKAGGAYLPIDPAYPPERISFMLKDSGTELLLAQGGLTENIEYGGEILYIDDEKTYTGDPGDLEHINSSNDVAYILYTSGTTGNPKGVMIEHKNVVRLLFNSKNRFDFNENDVWTMFHSYCFDFSVWEMYGALLYGGKLVIVPGLVAKDAGEYLRLIRNEGVTVLNQTPTAFYSLSGEEEKNRDCSLKIRYVIFGGEALKPIMLKAWRAKYPAAKLVNMYGITETTVHVTYKEIAEEEIQLNISNIGKPIPTLTTYILDRNMKLLPIGAVGELCVGGDGVARGYLNRPELTNEKFVKNSYTGERIYRSGDLARLLPNGEMEYLGRLDHQVKIRGHRIELGEIENQLLKIDTIKETVVLARGETSDNIHLCAYYVAVSPLPVMEIREKLKDALPEYMIPAYFLHMNRIPMTSNGKVNRKALPEPGGSINTGTEFVPPRNETEEKLAKVWMEVLAMDSVGVKDSFFSLGGDSIKAIGLINKTNQFMGTGIQIKDLYQNQTIEQLAVCVQKEVRPVVEDMLKEGLAAMEGIKQEIMKGEPEEKKLPPDFEDIYPLSSIQKGMMFFSKLRSEEPIYHDQFVYDVRIRDFDLDRFKKAIELICQKQSILRTTFTADGFDQPMQIVHKNRIPELSLADVSHLEEKEQKKCMDDYLENDVKDKFMVGNRLLWRLGVFKISKDRHYMVLSFQHAILDGWSVSVLIHELSKTYALLVEGKEPDMPGLRNSYKEYVAYTLGRSKTEENESYWKKMLEGYTRNKLPFNVSNKKINNVTGSRIFRRNLGTALMKKLEAAAQKYHCTLKEICLSAHIYLLGIITREKDIVTGVVTHDRPAIEDSDKILGCFLNTIPIRVDMNSVLTKSSLVEKVKEHQVKSKVHELFLGDIAGIIGESRSSNGNPIFDTLFNYTDFHILEGMEMPDLSESEEENQYESNEMTNTLFDLEISGTLRIFNLQIKYSPNYFYESDIETAYKLYVQILEKFADGDDEALDIEGLISAEEKNKILYAFNATRTPYEKHRLMHQLFEEQAGKVPENIALVFEDQKLTYRELNRRANQLAVMLIEKGVCCGDNVALLSNRNFEMIIGMLAIQKAGAAYVPIDPDYPAARRAYIMDNSKVTAVVADRDYGIDSDGVVQIDYGEMEKYSVENPGIAKDSRELAYIIYTSGSTGVPKGVMIEHHSAVNLISWVNKEFTVTEKDALLFITSMCFDLSVYDVFGTLAAGGKIVMAKKEQIQDPAQLKQLLKEEKITFWDSVPSTMNYIVNSIEENQEDYCQTDLRIVFMSGDWIPVRLPDNVRKYFPHARVISLGGATEGTVWSIYYPIEKVTEYQTSIPYGKPMDNNYFYILDDNRKVVPYGVAGELYIGGVGVARGYANDVEKTAAAFVENRFIPGEKMYKTGDLGRMLPDGNIEFLGRKDHQVKIRGYRVELGEIENQLLKYEDIREAVAVDRTDARGSKYLCVYFVSDRDITLSELREHLSGELPDYMMPAYFVRMERLPLTSNGKMDRKALPEPETVIEGVEYEAPRNETEQKLVDIWSQILGVEKIGINDSFFELGGNSLNITTLASRIRKEFSVELPIREIFADATVKNLARYIVQIQIQKTGEFFDKGE